MNPYAVHANALSAVQSFLGEDCPTFNWNGKDWSIVPGTAMTAQPLSAGGFGFDYDLTFSITVASFATVAADAVTLKGMLLNTRFSYLGDSYKVSGIKITPGALMLVIESNSINQGS